MTLDEKFAKIAQDAISEAEQVKCSGLDFRDGLRTMIEELTDRWVLAKAEYRGADE